MTITSQYKTTCRACGGSIQRGEQIEWARGEGSRHVVCPAAAAAEAVPDDAITMRCGSGYGGEPYEVGEVLRSYQRDIDQGQPEYLTVLSATQRYYREDGMSFGAGDEQGYVYVAKCRPATDDEVAPVLAAIAAAQTRKQAIADLNALGAQIRTTGERPGNRETPVTPEGDVVYLPGSGERLYGAGEWFVLGSEWIWFVHNNGMDGDNWSGNNVRTGGAGAIGWRVPATPELAEQIRQFVTAIGVKS